MTENILYYGDNLEILQNREYFQDECVDLIYLDPPFKSNQDYNVLFAEQNGSRAAAGLPLLPASSIPSIPRDQQVPLAELPQTNVQQV